MLNDKGLAKNQLGQVLRQRCCQHKPNFCWRRFVCSNKNNKNIKFKSGIIGRINNKRQWRKSMPM